MKHLQIQKISCGNNYAIGSIQLDRPERLNALSKDMVVDMLAILTQWQHDDSIVAVVLDASTERAFCAGGDVVAVYQAALQIRAYEAEGDDKDKDEGKDGNDIAMQYFTLEYQLDYLIHRYSKPFIAWSEGIIMGGGVGLFAGASHRVCGLHSQLAMPEVAIGFFPDVGATYFLRNTQPGVERLIALSGCRIAAADMQNNDFADYIIDSQTKTDVITRLQQLPWYGDRQRDAEMVDALLLEVAAKPQQAPSVLAAISEQLEQLSGLSDLNSQYDYILSWQPTNKFITQIQQGLISASPLSLHLVNAQLQQQHLTLPECFQFELSLARQCLVHGDFKEGVRALLIDKDKSPRWRFDSLGTVKQEDIDEMLTPSFSKSAHPLAHLAE